jgi:hypothetical protein
VTLCNHQSSGAHWDGGSRRRDPGTAALPNLNHVGQAFSRRIPENSQEKGSYLPQDDISSKYDVYFDDTRSSK